MPSILRNRKLRHNHYEKLGARALISRASIVWLGKRKENIFQDEDKRDDGDVTSEKALDGVALVMASLHVEAPPKSCKHSPDDCKPKLRDRRRIDDIPEPRRGSSAIYYITYTGTCHTFCFSYLQISNMVYYQLFKT